MIIRTLRKEDIDGVRRLLEGDPPYIAVYGPYIYWMLSRYCGECCFVAEEEERLVGYLGALQSPERHCLFLWQVSVKNTRRGQGVGAQLVERAACYAKGQGLHSLELSINGENRPSQRLFSSCAKRLGSRLEQVGEQDFEGVTEFIYSIAL